jgi:hypothetical protein
MDPTGSPFRRPPSRPAFRPRRSGFGPVPAASLAADARSAPAARGRSRDVARETRGRALRLGAGAFYLVAALTLSDAALSFASHDPGVIIGLGLTRWAAGATPIAWMALPFVVGFVLLGLLAHRGRLWAFGIGAAVYALDGLIVVAAHDWVGVAIHTVVLVMMVRGLDAGRRLS